MSIRINLDVEMAKNKISSGALAEIVGITQANLSILKTGKAKAIRFSTLEAICKALNCQPGDILEFIDDGENAEGIGNEKHSGTGNEPRRNHCRNRGILSHVLRHAENSSADHGTYDNGGKRKRA